MVPDHDNTGKEMFGDQCKVDSGIFQHFLYAPGTVTGSTLTAYYVSSTIEPS